MSQFSAVMLINSNGQYVNPDYRMTIDGVNYCMAELVEANNAKHALDIVHGMVFGNEFNRKLLFYNAIRFAVCETTEENLVINPVEFNFNDPVSTFKH